MTEQTDVTLDARDGPGSHSDFDDVWSADPMLSQVHDHLGAVPRT